METWLTLDDDRLRLPITPTFNVQYRNNNQETSTNEKGASTWQESPVFGKRPLTASFQPNDMTSWNLKARKWKIRITTCES